MIMPFSEPQECAVCKRVFLSSHQLISHYNAAHSNRQYSTFSSSPAAAAAAAPTTFRHYTNVNGRNPNPDFQARNQFDVNYYRRGYLDDQGRFHKGSPHAPAMSPTRKYKFLLPKMPPTTMPETPKLMDLFPETSSGGTRTLPLLCQLDQWRPEDSAVAENGGANSSPIDLSLRL